MRISDWSSDVCSSDLAEQADRLREGVDVGGEVGAARGLDATADRPDGDRGVGAELEFAGKHGVDGLVAHHDEDDLLHLAADLQADGARNQGIERRWRPAPGGDEANEAAGAALGPEDDATTPDAHR